MRWMTFTLIALSGGIVAAPGLAEQGKDRPAPDPNEKMCQTESVVGSRLATRRVCATRAEWAERRRLDREAIDQGQRSPCMISRTSSTGRASC